MMYVMTPKEIGATMDGCGFTEHEWEKMWESETATATVHKACFDDETFCEACECEVVYGGPEDKHGKCGCDEQ